MNFHSVAEIYDSIDKTRERLYRRAESLSEEQSSFRSTPEVWSAAHIIEHLSIIESQVTKLLGVLVHKAEAAGNLRDETQPFAPVSLAEFAERARTEKYTAPEAMKPGGEASLADSVARLRESREMLRQLRPRIEKIDGTGLQYPHPAWGPLNLYQWLALIGAHEERHLRQLETLLQSAGIETQSDGAAN